MPQLTLRHLLQLCNDLQVFWEMGTYQRLGLSDEKFWNPFQEKTREMFLEVCKFRQISGQEFAKNMEPLDEPLPQEIQKKFLELKEWLNELHPTFKSLFMM